MHMSRENIKHSMSRDFSREAMYNFSSSLLQLHIKYCSRELSEYLEAKHQFIGLYITYPYSNYVIYICTLRFITKWYASHTFTHLRINSSTPANNVVAFVKAL